MKLITINDKEYPERLRIIPSPPQKIYVLGNEKILNEPAIAIVGSRSCTAYGKMIALKFAEDFTTHGINVISGLARGIDTCAHKGCLKENGKTVAVLGGGLNRVYPEENIYLFNEIIKSGGAAVSEYAPEVEAYSDGFRKRNRIVSGLSLATLIVEAAVNSGTMITARYTVEQGKKVFCIPGRLDDNKGIGTNELLKKGAKIATCVEDILNELNIGLGFTVKNKEKNIKEEYMEIYNLLLDECLTPNQICKILNKRVAEINSKLLFMEMDGLIKKNPGNIYEIVR